MDHCQLSEGSYAQLVADDARKEAKKALLMLEAVAKILGISSEELLQRGQQIEKEAEVLKRQKEREEREADERARIDAGMSPEMWAAHKMAAQNVSVLGEQAASFFKTIHEKMGGNYG